MAELEEVPSEQENSHFVSDISVVVSHLFGHGGYARRD
jgi:hypothetical protein